MNDCPLRNEMMAISALTAEDVSCYRHHPGDVRGVIGSLTIIYERKIYNKENIRIDSVGLKEMLW